MKAIVLIGRIFFSLIFLNTIFAHFSSSGINYAASAGVPFAEILVPVSGILAVLGGLSILLGYKAKFGAWLLVLFLIPVTLLMHNFWTLEGAEAQMQMVNFIKNLSLLGGAFLITYFGAGPLSIDNAIASKPAIKESSKRQKFQPEFSREHNQNQPERTPAQRQRDKERAERG
jgi:putative oxidoreductase